MLRMLESLTGEIDAPFPLRLDTNGPSEEIVGEIVARGPNALIPSKSLCGLGFGDAGGGVWFHLTVD